MIFSLFIYAPIPLCDWVHYTITVIGALSVFRIRFTTPVMSYQILNLYLHNCIITSVAVLYDFTEKICCMVVVLFFSLLHTLSVLCRLRGNMRSQRTPRVAKQRPHMRITHAWGEHIRPNCCRLKTLVVEYMQALMGHHTSSEINISIKTTEIETNTKNVVSPPHRY